MFFSKSSKRLKFKRSYFDDCYGIIDGVKEGLGSAVMSEHLVADDKKIKIVKEYGSVDVPVYLHHYSQGFYTKLQNQIIQELTENSKKYL